jgi:acyl-CoA synthetase (AMP-forming)/AMP-acid ligase II
MPKGVMWRQEDLWTTLGGGGDPITGDGKPASLAEHADNIKRGLNRLRLLPASPLMHGTGLFTAISSLMHGGGIVTTEGRKFDAHELWRAVEAKRVNVIAIVGDVFARPMAEALDEKSYDLSSLRMIISSGVMFSPEIKQRLLDHHGGMLIVDSLGASEATGIGVSISSAAGPADRASFKIGNRVKVFTDEGREVAPGSGERGRVARAGPIPMGYYKDAAKSAQTFPVINGVRYSMPGDYATVAEDGTIVLLGRGSVCINTGGEKVFPEEVEEVIKRHPKVRDAAVVGLPDAKWGQAVTAIVEPTGAGAIDEEEIRSLVRDTLAGYKVPKRVFTVVTLGRSPAGKMDYKAVTETARQLAKRGS